MAKVQTRRSVSLNRQIYDHLRAYCEENGLPISRTAEKCLVEFLDLEVCPECRTWIAKTKSSVIRCTHEQCGYRSDRPWPPPKMVNPYGRGRRPATQKEGNAPTLPLCPQCRGKGWLTNPCVSCDFCFGRSRVSHAVLQNWKAVERKDK